MYSRTPRPRFLYRGLINGFGGSAGDRFGTESPIKLCVVATAFGRELMHGLRAVGYQGLYVCLSNSHSHSRSHSLSLSLSRSLSLSLSMAFSVHVCAYMYTHICCINLHQLMCLFNIDAYIENLTWILSCPSPRPGWLARPLVPGIGTPG